MASVPLQTLVRQLRGLVVIASVKNQSDRALLRAFWIGKDQEAFATLFTRHSSLVSGVCRRVLRHRVAHRIALNARRASARRLKHESQATMTQPKNPEWEANWREVQL